jgi:hypothetical protein
MRGLIFSGFVGAAALAALAAGCGNRAGLGAAAGGSPTPTDSATPSPTGTAPTHPDCTGTSGSVSANGGTIDCLSFAVVGDTRPATVDDTAGYPTSIITKIYQDLEAENPRPKFAVATGDYVFANKNGAKAAPQFDKYLTAQALFSNIVYHAMGNHECTGYTTSNCGAGNADGTTVNYTSFLSKMPPPSGSKPYYTVRIGATDSSWTAKFVVVAANAWDAAQATWLDSAMAQATTYTFVVRHEGIYANTAPGVDPSGNIIKNYPYTLLVEGHTHTISYFSADRELINGAGGAPLTGSINYGYVIAKQRQDMAMDFTAYDYQTRAVMKHFVVTPTGSTTN